MQALWGSPYAAAPRMLERRLGLLVLQLADAFAQFPSIRFQSPISVVYSCLLAAARLGTTCMQVFRIEPESVTVVYLGFK